MPDERLTRYVQAGSIVFSLFVAVGVVWYSHDVRKAVVIVAVVTLYLAGWLLVSRSKYGRVQLANQPASSPTYLSWGAWALLFSMVAWLLNGLLSSRPPENAAAAIRWVLLTAGATLLGFVFAIIGVSQSGSVVGKNLAAVAVISTLALVGWVLARIAFGF